MWRIFLTEHEVANKITFSAVSYTHFVVYCSVVACQLHRCLKLSVAASEDFPRSNSYFGNSFINFWAVYPLSRYTFLIEIWYSLLNSVFTWQ